MRSKIVSIIGHAHHGKTELTRALTEVNTDLLVEEIERKMSIQLGYAPFKVTDELTCSIIDVPGHQKFIKRMILGVMSADCIVLTIAANEGVKPQTIEHLNIINLLDIKTGIVVVTKTDLHPVNNLEKNINKLIKGSIFENQKIYYVDSLKSKGIHSFKKALSHVLLNNKNVYNQNKSLYLPIDDVFEKHGHGLIVRGTIQTGQISNGQKLFLYPGATQVKVKQMQNFKMNVNKAAPKQRIAINLKRIKKAEVTRGMVLSNEQLIPCTNVIDVTLKTISLSVNLKQRSTIKLYLGSLECEGKIVFFDRNKLEKMTDTTIYCQFILNKEIVAPRGSKFIIKALAPNVIIGGGIVIEAFGGKYKHHKETIKQLKTKSLYSPEEYLINIIKENILVNIDYLRLKSEFDNETLTTLLNNYKQMKLLINFNSTSWIHSVHFEKYKKEYLYELEKLHTINPLKIGVNISYLRSKFIFLDVNLINYISKALIMEGKIKSQGESVFLTMHKPHIPIYLQKKVEIFITDLFNDGYYMHNVNIYLNTLGIKLYLQKDLLKYLQKQKRILSYTDKKFISYEFLVSEVKKIKSDYPHSFSIQDAKKTLKISRKHLIIFIELLDQLGFTKRETESRIWLNSEDIFLD